MQQDINIAIAMGLKALKNIHNIPFNCAFKDALPRVTWDYSLDSLQQLDKLLLDIRQQVKPDYGQMVNSSAGQGFLTLIASYAMATVAKLGNYTVKWFDFEGFKALTGNHTATPVFETAAVCLMNGQLMTPIAVASHRLFGPDPGKGYAGHAQAMLQQPGEFFYLYDNLEKLSLPAGIQQQHHTVFRLADTLGILTAFTLATAPAAEFPPMVLSPANKLFLQLPPECNRSEYISGHLDANTEKHPALAAIHDAYVYPYYGKAGAIVLESRVYDTPNAPVLKIMIPYHASADSSHFKLNKPMLLGSQWNMVELKVISHTILTRIREHPLAESVWRQHYQSSVT